MKLNELLSPLKITAEIDCEIKELTNDSRKVSPNSLFIAYPGARFDGRDYIKSAINSGAQAVLYDPIDFTLDSSINIPCIPIPNLVTSLGVIGRKFYLNPKRLLNITGVTGTNGKTTIAYQLAEAHSLLNTPAVYIGTLGAGRVSALTPLANTTPDALCIMQLLHKYQQQGVTQVCMEVSSHALCEHRVDAVDFTQAIYTNLSHEHLDYHHTMQEYADAKAKLFGYKSLNFTIINQDDAYTKLMQEQKPATCRQYTYGINNQSDFRAFNCHMTSNGSEFDVATPVGIVRVKTKSVGEFNIYNSLAVFASLMAHGYALEDILDVMPKLNRSPGRLEVVSQEPMVVVDYAHTPDALENVLKTLIALNKVKKNPGRLWVVFGCGGDRDASKRPLMGRVASQYTNQVILTSDNPRSEKPAVIIDEIAAGVLDNVVPVKIIDRYEAIVYALQHASKEDLVLIAGKGHEAYQQIGATRIDFSDQQVVREALGLLSGLH